MVPDFEEEDVRCVIVYGRETREVVDEIKAWTEVNNGIVNELEPGWFAVLIRAPWHPKSATMVQVLNVELGQVEGEVHMRILTYMLNPCTLEEVLVSKESDVDFTEGFRVREEFASRLAALSTGGMQPPPSSQHAQPTATAAKFQPQTPSQGGAIAYPTPAVQGSPQSPSERGSAFRCSSCGREASERWKFCKWCGSPVRRGSDVSGYVQPQAQARAPPVPHIPLPPPPAFANYAQQGQGEAGKKRSWWRDHVGASRIYHCRTNGCGWSGTMDQMPNTVRFREVPVPITTYESGGHRTNDPTATPRITGFRYFNEEVRAYSCPKCHRVVKEKVVKSTLIRSTGY